MKKLIDYFQYNGLFYKMFIVMVVSIVLVSLLITFNTIRMSERLFMETFSITNSKILNQIKSGFETFSYSIVIATNNVQQNGTIKSFLTEADADSITMNKAFYSMNEQMTRISSNLDTYEVNMIVTGVNGRSYTTNYAYWPISVEELHNHVISHYTYTDPNHILYQYVPPSVKHDREVGSAIVASKALVERSTGDHYGFLYTIILESEFNKFYNNYTSNENDVIILDNDGLVVSSNQKGMIGQKSLELLEHAKKIDKEEIDFLNEDVLGRNHIILAEYLPSYDMYLINLIDKELVMNHLIDTKTIVLISIVIVAVALLIVFLISRKVTKSLRVLVQQISTMAKNDFDQYVTEDGSYETKQLAQTFNFMLDELHDYVERLLQTEKKQRNAELEALQQQINPHFLYNTLSSVKIMVHQGNKEKATDMIHALISLLQNVIGNISETITVEQELANIKNYVFINQVRYGERIKVQYFISPDCLDYHVPKLMIQPFIENAFFHAFNKKTDGRILLLIGRKADSLICEIIDNGDGMQVYSNQRLPNYKSKRQKFSGIGVRNVDERIKLLYGDTYGVEIASQVGEGTTVKIILPLLQEENITNI